ETAPLQLSSIVPAGEGDALLREVNAVNPSLRTQLQQTLQVGAATASDVQNVPLGMPVHLPHAAAGQRSVETVHSVQNHPSPESLRTARVLQNIVQETVFFHIAVFNFCSTSNDKHSCRHPTSSCRDPRPRIR